MKHKRKIDIPATVNIPIRDFRNYETLLENLDKKKTILCEYGCFYLYDGDEALEVLTKVIDELRSKLNHLSGENFELKQKLENKSWF